MSSSGPSEAGRGAARQRWRARLQPPLTRHARPVQALAWGELVGRSVLKSRLVLASGDAEHQSTDLAVESSNPSRRASRWNRSTDDSEPAMADLPATPQASDTTRRDATPSRLLDRQRGH